MIVIKAVIAILVGLYLLDRLCLWLEAKGWLYYRHHQSQGGFLGSTLLELNSFLHPSVRHTIEMKQNQVQFKHCDQAGDPPKDC